MTATTLTAAASLAADLVGIEDTHQRLLAIEQALDLLADAIDDDLYCGCVASAIRDAAGTARGNAAQYLEDASDAHREEEYRQRMRRISWAS